MVRQLGETWMLCNGGQFYEQTNVVAIESLLLLCLKTFTWIVQGNDMKYQTISTLCWFHYVDGNSCYLAPVNGKGW
jgi:hypothetical protein